MRLRQLRISLQTSDGPYGTSLSFPDGLVVVWADNSMGKSTCARAILVALGLEAMLSTSQQELPLPPAMTTKLDSATGEHAVLESEVYLEIENSKGERIVVQRAVKGTRDKNLVTVHNGPALSTSKSYASIDYFVSRSGAATRDAGFHRFLASFLGWELPLVQTYDGNEVPLYLQCIFPFFVVEQTRGWSTVLPPIPTQFRIRDAHKRAIEFLLDMDAHKIALQRQSLHYRKQQLEREWMTRVQSASEIATTIGGAVQALPKSPVATWPPPVAPTVSVPEDEKWRSLADRIMANVERQRQLVQHDIPRVEEIATAAQRDLVSADTEVQRKQALLSRLMETLEAETQEVARVRERLIAIDEDIKRNKDVRTLKTLGSRKESPINHGSCPVCHQAILDSLVPLPPHQAVMSLDENIAFLSEQRRTFEGVLSHSLRVAESRTLQVHALREEVSRARDLVRALRQTLISDGRAPSLAAVYERVELESQIKRDTTAAERLADLFDGFSSMAHQWKLLQQELDEMPSNDVTDADREKIHAWTSVVRSQLADYGFRSLSPSQIVVSQDTYRPEYEGFDLQSTISASDLIRTIWAYLNGMLELSRTSKTHHPGTVLFDEPRQQSTRDVSFAALLRRAAAAAGAQQQVIFFTSEDRVRLESHLQALPHKFIAIDGRVLQPTAASG